jgi:hypothetical protein
MTGNRKEPDYFVFADQAEVVILQSEVFPFQPVQPGPGFTDSWHI